MLISTLKYLFVTLLLVSCSHQYAYAPICVRGNKGTSLEAEYDIKELVFRNMMPKSDPHVTVCISFGEENSQEIDPPPEFFQRLKDFDLNIKPVSEKPIEDDDAYFVVIKIEIPQWYSEIEAPVAIYMYRHLALKQWYQKGDRRQWWQRSAIARWSDNVWRLEFIQ